MTNKKEKISVPKIRNKCMKCGGEYVQHTEADMVCNAHGTKGTYVREFTITVSWCLVCGAAWTTIDKENL